MGMSGRSGKLSVQPASSRSHSVCDVVQKDRQQKEPAHAHEADNWRYTLNSEVICEAPPLASSGSLVVPAFNWLRQCIRPWCHRDGFHFPRLGHRRAGGNTLNGMETVQVTFVTLLQNGT